MQTSQAWGAGSGFLQAADAGARRLPTAEVLAWGGAAAGGSVKQRGKIMCVAVEVVSYMLSSRHM